MPCIFTKPYLVRKPEIALG
jgi:hypothetical protein